MEESLIIWYRKQPSFKDVLINWLNGHCNVSYQSYWKIENWTLKVVSK